VRVGVHEEPGIRNQLERPFAKPKELLIHRGSPDEGVGHDRQARGNPRPEDQADDRGA
jgi:hypothetical protein